jgi:hypothetical protein
MLGAGVGGTYLYLAKQGFRIGEGAAFSVGPCQLSMPRAMISFITSLAPP